MKNAALFSSLFLLICLASFFPLLVIGTGSQEAAEIATPQVSTPGSEVAEAAQVGIPGTYEKEETKTVVHGVIETCHGGRLHKHPVLKSFVKEGEAEGYENVAINYVVGALPVLKVTTRKAETGETIGEVEEIALGAEHLQYKKALHDLMERYGFVKKHHEEVQKIIEKRTIEYAKEVKHRDNVIKERCVKTIKSTTEQIGIVKEEIRITEEKGEDPSLLHVTMDNLVARLEDRKERLAVLKHKYNASWDEL